MPISEYFGGHGKEVMESMEKEYGPKHGEAVFYATTNKHPELKPSGDSAGSNANGLDEIVFNPQSVAAGGNSAYRDFPGKNEGPHE